MKWLQQWGIDPKSLPSVAGSRKGKLYVCGGGRTLWDDMERAGFNTRDNRFPDGDVMAVNDAGTALPGIVSHWFSNHGDLLLHWIAIRGGQQTRDQFEAGIPIVTHSLSPHEGVKWVWPWPGQGSSSLGATLTGFGLGYEQVVLCGVPLDNSGHFFDAPWFSKGCNFDNGTHKRAWLSAKTVLGDRIRSMSGYTREWFGEP